MYSVINFEINICLLGENIKMAVFCYMQVTTVRMVPSPQISFHVHPVITQAKLTWWLLMNVRAAHLDTTVTGAQVGSFVYYSISILVLCFKCLALKI